MKISKKSWHYKLNRFFDSNLDWQRKVGFCAYFWKTMFCLMFSFVGLAIVTLIAYLGLNLFFGIILGLFGVELSIINVELMLGTLLMGFICSCGYAVILLSDTMVGKLPWLPSYVSKYLPKSKPKKSQEVVKEPSIFKEYYKAYKSKFCPYVEIE